MPSVLGKFGRAGTALVAFTALGASHVFAADQLDAPVFETEQTTEVEFGTGWYIRGDMSFGQTFNNDDTRVSAWNDESTLEIPHSFGIGAGKYITDSFRAEVAIEHFSVMKTFADNGACAIPDCQHSSRGEASASTASFNAYWDIANLGGFKPYVGAGVGLAALEWTSFQAIGIAADGSVADAPVIETDASYQLMWNLQAGASYRFAKNWHIDANYRISGITGDEFQDTAAAIGSRKTFDTGDFLNQEVRIGLRYDIW